MASYNQQRESLEVIDANAPSSFDLAAFSRFKHGDGSVTSEYGQALAEHVLEVAPQFSEDTLITGSCFKYTPVASHYLARETQYWLNSSAADHDRDPVKHIKIDRAELFDGDYSAMTNAERARLLQSDRITADLGRLAGKRLIVVDDIRITGGHEKKIASLLEQSDVEDVLFLYVAELRGDTDDPTIEDRLNRSTITEPADLIPLFSEPGFKLNSRAVKFVIGRFTSEDRAVLLATLDNEARRALWSAVMHNGYYQMPQYADAARQLYLAVEPVASYEPQAFNAERYSQMKYGSLEAAREYGAALYDQIVENSPELLRSDNLVLSPGATADTPKAAHAICEELLYRVNTWRYENGMKPARQLDLHSSNLAAGDYGKLSQAEREARHSQSAISGDYEVLRGADVVVIDDISISGQTALVMDKVFDGLPVRSYRQLFAAKIDPKAAEQNPAIESEINQASIDSLASLSELAARERFAINQRVAKFVLSRETRSELSDFITHAPEELLQSVERAALMDGMYLLEDYTDSFDQIKQAVRSQTK